MAMEPGSPEHEASIAHLSPEWQEIIRAQRLQHCSQFPAGECEDFTVGTPTLVYFATEVGQWNETHYSGDGSIDWAKTIEARLKNAPLVYGAGAVIGALVLRQVLK